VKVSTLTISGFPLGSPETKCHLDVGLVERHIVYDKGEGGGFPQVRVVVSLVSPNCPWIVLAPKVFQLCTNHLMLVLCRFMWVVEACQFLLIPSRSSNTPLYPSKVLQAREHAPTFIFLLFSVSTHIWNPQGVGSASVKAQKSFCWTFATLEMWFLHHPFCHG